MTMQWTLDDTEMAFIIHHRQEFMDTIPILTDFDFKLSILLKYIAALLSYFREICKIESADQIDVEIFEIGIGIYF